MRTRLTTASADQRRARGARTGFLGLASLAVVVASAGAPAGCGSARRDTPFSEPLEMSDPQVVRGQVVFARNCHQCHPGGAGGLAPAINDKPLPEGAMKKQIRTGFLGRMPSFSEDEISDEDVDAVIVYLKALRGLEESG